MNSGCDPYHDRLEEDPETHPDAREWWCDPCELWFSAPPPAEGLVAECPHCGGYAEEYDGQDE